MPVFKQRGVLSGIQVKAAMRRNVHRMLVRASITDCVRGMLKSKSNAVLVDSAEGKPVGVVSRTDAMGAYYAGLPSDTRLGDIMAGPPCLCYPDDTIEDALDVMQQDGIHRVYVRGAHSDEITGTLAYSDIVGLLYRYCLACAKSHMKKISGENEHSIKLISKEVMTDTIISCHEDSAVSDVIELLASRHLGAVLVLDSREKPKGVISKTDLNLAYIHGTALTEPAGSIMNSPVAGLGPETSVDDAIRQMLMLDVQRLFVIDNHTGHGLGVVSLSDVARFRSGTCQACTTSRIMQTFR